MFVPAVEREKTEVAAGVTRQVLGYDPQLMMVRMTFRKGTSVPRHAHPHRQVSYVEQGRIEATLGNDTRVVAPGDSFFVPPDLPHSVLAVEDSIVIETFSPAREEFVNA